MIRLQRCSNSSGGDVYANRSEMREAEEGGGRGECECERYVVLKMCVRDAFFYGFR